VEASPYRQIRIDKKAEAQNIRRNLIALMALMPKTAHMKHMGSLHKLNCSPWNGDHV
jgi:hypothetical protein